MNLRSLLKLARHGNRKHHDDNLSERIQAKWVRDQAHLPLTPEHWELYEIIHQLYWNQLHDFPELVNCRDLNDRIQWLKLLDQDEKTIRCVDKIRVRDFVRERIGDNHLPVLYQTCDHFNEIDFNLLPGQFVIKANHDSGSVILVRDKNNFDRIAAETRIENSLKQKYGWENGEWAYSFVPPRILIEEFIGPGVPTPPPDYRFYISEACAHFVHYNQVQQNKKNEQILDPSGKDLSIKFSQNYPRYGNEFHKPRCWDEMIRIAEKLGEGFKFIRVDLYCSKDKIYAGEMTFWPGGGCYQGDGQKKLGRLLDFDRTTFKPPIYQQLKKQLRIRS
jgi:hypothetical protein